MRLPDAFLSGLGSEENDALALVYDEFLDEHQAHERLTEADAVAEECSAVLLGDLEQGPVSFLLVAIQLGEHLGSGLVPFSGGELVPLEVFLEGFRVDFKGGIFLGVALDDLHDRFGDFHAFIPVMFEPFL